MPTYECPTCRNVVTLPRREEAPSRPFCCQRCKLLDLGRWLDGTYTVSEPISPADFGDAIADEPAAGTD